MKKPTLHYHAPNNQLVSPYWSALTAMAVLSTMIGAILCYLYVAGLGIGDYWIINPQEITLLAWLIPLVCFAWPVFLLCWACLEWWHKRALAITPAVESPSVSDAKPDAKR